MTLSYYTISEISLKNGMLSFLKFAQINVICFIFPNFGLPCPFWLFFVSFEFFSLLNSVKSLL